MNWVRHGGSTMFETKSRYCRAKVEFNSINWVWHGSSTTFETGLRETSSLGVVPNDSGSTYERCFCPWNILEIRFRKNLAKLTGSAVRINNKKPKGKNTMKEKKETGSSHAGIWTCTPTSSCQKSAISDHWAMRPLLRMKGKIWNSAEVFFSAIHTVWTLWSCIYDEFKDTFEEK